MIVIALIATTLHYDISFWEWSALGIPLVLAGLVLIFFICGLVLPLRGEERRLPVPEEYLKSKLRELGPVTRYEHIAMAVMGVALLLWCFGRSWPGWPDGKPEAGYSPRRWSPYSWEPPHFSFPCAKTGNPAELFSP